MSNTAGEIVKFFLEKSWAVLVLSLLTGFFATILMPSDWRNSIPLENNDLRVIVSFGVASMVFYVAFSGIRALFKTIINKIKYSQTKRKIEQHKMKEEREDIKQFLTHSPDKFYSLIEHLVNNDNSWTYVYPGHFYEDDYFMNTEWFLIEDAPEKQRINKRNGDVCQEIYMGRYKMKLRDRKYQDLMTIKSETGNLSYRYRDIYPYEWEIVKTNK